MTRIISWAASTTQTTSPVTSPAPSASAADAAASIFNQHTSDLVKGDFAAAWALLAADGPTRSQTFAAWSAERRLFFEKVAGRYTIAVSPSDVGPLANWLASPWSSSSDLACALVVEVTYPAIAGHNAGDGI